MTRIEAGPISLELLRERALWWGEERTLFLADVHVGKDEALRAGGIGLPPGTTEADLDRLADLVRAHDTRRLVILGDFLHARSSRSPAILGALQRWRQELAEVDIQLIRGNHDRASGDPPAQLDISVVEGGASLGPLTLYHEPPDRREAADSPATYGLAGHLHPAVRLRGAGADRLKVPVFFERHVPGAPPCLVLPAFSTFTGGALVRPGARDRVWAVDATGVVAIPQSALRARMGSTRDARRAGR